MNLPLFVPRATLWFKATSAVGVAALLLFAGAAWRWPWRPGRVGGLAFGIAAALLFLAAGLYPWRRRWRGRPFGTAQRWLHVHVYASVLATLCVFIHIGFQWPAGVIGWLLLLLSIWTTGTGIAGVWLQRRVPLLLARRVSVEAIYERIPELVGRLAAEADALMIGATDVLARSYTAEIRPLLAGPRASMAWLTGTNSAREDALRPLARLRSFLNEADASRLADLETILHDKVDLDAQISLQYVLRTWLAVHVPPAMLLFGLVAVHVAAVVWH